MLYFIVMDGQMPAWYSCSHLKLLMTEIESWNIQSSVIRGCADTDTPRLYWCLCFSWMTKEKIDGETVTCVPPSLSTGHKPPPDYEEIPKIRCLHFGVCMCLLVSSCMCTQSSVSLESWVCLFAVCELSSTATSTP